MGNATSSNAGPSRSKDIVVFWIISDSTCAECGEELGKGRFLRLEANVVELAVRAHIRHEHTPYDRLLAQGADRSDARQEVAAQVDVLMARWSSPR